nr:beta-ketoacyl synthase N-terminal-like domain-containing protein [Streptomyces tailanensis]
MNTSSAESAPIAVVGMDRRFPGAEDADAFWELLDGGRHHSAPLPTDRGWDQTFLYNEDRAAEGSTYVRRGASWRRWPGSTRRSSGSARSKPRPWTLSSAS